MVLATNHPSKRCLSFIPAQDIKFVLPASKLKLLDMPVNTAAGLTKNLDIDAFEQFDDKLHIV